jgi:hypothetical protein
VHRSGSGVVLEIGELLYRYLSSIKTLSISFIICSSLVLVLCFDMCVVAINWARLCVVSSLWALSDIVELFSLGLVESREDDVGIPFLSS